MFSAFQQFLKKLSKDKTLKTSVLNFAALFAVAAVFFTLTVDRVIVPAPQPILPVEYSTLPTNKMDNVALEQALRAHSSGVQGLVTFSGLNSVVVLGQGLDHDQLVVNADVDEMRKLATAEKLPVSTKAPALVTSITTLAPTWWWFALCGQFVWLGYLLFASREGGDQPNRISVAITSTSDNFNAFLKARKISAVRFYSVAIVALMAINLGALGLGLYQDKNVYLMPSDLAGAQTVQYWQISRYVQTNPERFQRVTFVKQLNSAYILLNQQTAVPAVGVPGTVPRSTPVDTTAPAGTATVPVTIAPPAPAPVLTAMRTTFPATAAGNADYAAFVAAVGAKKIETKDVPAVHDTNLWSTLTPVGIVLFFVFSVWAMVLFLLMRNRIQNNNSVSDSPRTGPIFDQRNTPGTSGPTGSDRNQVATREEDKKTFADVAGCQEAIDELIVVQKKIMRPRLYKIFGAPVPSGVILYGPPGTGKTLLARALAGEVGGSFQALSGSEFVEMYVGVGAKRVREAYAKARADARKTGRVSIVFIDEFDALAKKRSNSSEGGNREYEQTLNQLLVEMNGFGNHGLVLTMAATNRLDILDEAVLRPGRFDIKVKVPKPDRKGRALIYGIYLKKLKIVMEGEGEVREANFQKMLDDLARRSHDFSGAEIEGAIKDGATIAVERQFGNVLEDITPEQEEEYRNRAIITEQDLHLGIDKMAYGTQIRSRVRTDKERWATAVHECGHASVPTALGGDPVNRITIVMTDKSLGLMDSSPEEGERYDWTREQFMVRLKMMLAGRAAEKVILSKISTGASNDFERASQLARQMVGVFGMSEEFGNKSIPLDQYGFPASNIGENMLQKFNDTWGGIIDKLQAETEAHIEQHREQIERCARALFEEETLTGDEFRRIWKGEDAPQSEGEAVENSAAQPQDANVDRKANEEGDKHDEQ